MKKLISILLVAALLLSLVTVASAEEEKAKYTVSIDSYDGAYINGHVAQVSGPPTSEKIKVRVTVFMGSAYVSVEVTLQGSLFTLMAFGPIDYITAVANAVTADNGRVRLAADEYFVD